jgi:hypothetical protein
MQNVDALMRWNTMHAAQFWGMRKEGGKEGERIEVAA